MKATEKAYFAGLLDGEGSIMIVNPWPLQLIVSISQLDRRREMLDWMKNHFRFFIDLPIMEHSSGSIVEGITVRSVKAKKLLLKLLPYLIVKKPQARLGIAFQILKDARYTVFRAVSNPERLDKKFDLLISSVQDMMKQMNHRGNGYTPVAETERENLITLCRYKANEIRERQSTPAELETVG